MLATVLHLIANVAAVTIMAYYSITFAVEAQLTRKKVDRVTAWSAVWNTFLAIGPVLGLVLLLVWK